MTKGPDEILPPKKNPRSRRGKPSFPKAAKKGQIPEKEAQVLINRFVHKMTLYDSAKNAGVTQSDKYRTVASAASHIIAKHRSANSEFLESLGDIGVDASLVAKKIKDGLDAKTVVKVRDGKDKDKLIVMPDRAVQHKFVETALDIYGAKAPKKIEVESMTFEQRLTQVIDEEDDLGLLE